MDTNKQNEIIESEAKKLGINIKYPTKLGKYVVDENNKELTDRKLPYTTFACWIPLYSAEAEAEGTRKLTKLLIMWLEAIRDDGDTDVYIREFFIENKCNLTASLYIRAFSECMLDKDSKIFNSIIPKKDECQAMKQVFVV